MKTDANKAKTLKKKSLLLFLPFPPISEIFMNLLNLSYSSSSERLVDY